MMLLPTIKLITFFILVAVPALALPTQREPTALVARGNVRLLTFLLEPA